MIQKLCVLPGSFLPGTFSSCSFTYVNVSFFTLPAKIYLFKVSNRNTRKMCEICLQLTMKTPERRNWRRSGVFIVNFEHISHLLLVFRGSIVTFEQAYHVCHVTMFVVCWDQAVERSNTLRNIWQQLLREMRL